MAAGLRSNFLCDIPAPPSLQNTPPCFAAPWWAAAAMLDVYLPGCPEGLSRVLVQQQFLRPPSLCRTYRFVDALLVTLQKTVRSAHELCSIGTVDLDMYPA